MYKNSCLKNHFQIFVKVPADNSHGRDVFSGKIVIDVRNHHTRFSNCPITYGHTFYMLQVG